MNINLPQTLPKKKKMKRRECFLTHSIKASVTLIPKADKDTTGK